MSFKNFEIEVRKSREGLYQAISISDKGRIRDWGLTQDLAVRSAKLSILKYEAISLEYPVIIYQPYVNWVIFANHKAEQLFDDAYGLFEQLPAEDKKILESSLEFEFIVENKIFQCVATDYRIPTKVRCFQLLGQPKKDLDYLYNCENNPSEA